MLALADLLAEVGRLGEEEQRAAVKVLTAFAEYGRAVRQAGPAGDWPRRGRGGRRP